MKIIIVGILADRVLERPEGLSYTLASGKCFGVFCFCFCFFLFSFMFADFCICSKLYCDVLLYDVLCYRKRGFQIANCGVCSMYYAIQKS